MMLIAQNRNDIMARFHNSLLLGNVEERIKILAEIGQLHLAYITAVTYGYSDLASPLRESLENPQETLSII